MNTVTFTNVEKIIAAEEREEATGHHITLEVFTRVGRCIIFFHRPDGMIDFRSEVKQCMEV